MKQYFILAHAGARARAAQAVADAPAGHAVAIRPPSRTLTQNAKLHAMFTDVARQAKYFGRKLEAAQWKALFISGHAIATGEPADVVPGLENEFCNIRESSAQMTVARMNSLIEYIHAWGAQHGVNFENNNERSTA